MANIKEKAKYHSKMSEWHINEFRKALDNWEDKKTIYCDECFIELPEDNHNHGLCFGCWDKG